MLHAPNQILIRGKSLSNCVFAILDLFFFFFGQINNYNEIGWLLLAARQGTGGRKDELRVSNSMHE